MFYLKAVFSQYHQFNGRWCFWRPPAPCQWSVVLLASSCAVSMVGGVAGVLLSRVNGRWCCWRPPAPCRRSVLSMVGAVAGVLLSHVLSGLDTKHVVARRIRLLVVIKHLSQYNVQRRRATLVTA